MATQTRYGPMTHSFVLNNKPIKDWSAADTPTQLTPEEDKRNIEMQHSGGSVLTERMAVRLDVTVSIQPGTEDSAMMSGLYNSGESLEGVITSIGTLEKIIVSSGVVVGFEPIGRGFKPSHDTYKMQFAAWVMAMGGGQ